MKRTGSWREHRVPVIQHKSRKEECQKMQTNWQTVDEVELCRPGLDFGPHLKGNMKSLKSFAAEVDMIRDSFTKIPCSVHIE